MYLDLKASQTIGYGITKRLFGSQKQREIIFLIKFMVIIQKAMKINLLMMMEMVDYI